MLNRFSHFCQVIKLRHLKCHFFQKKLFLVFLLNYYLLENEQLRTTR